MTPRSLRNRAYYSLKPFLPRSARRAFRSWLARRKRLQVGDLWPILPGSEHLPEGWPGWPDGKKFALVLTHDVEGQEGVDRCREVAELEMQLGFRSSFNFIPAGSYALPQALRTYLTENGFEIGVHDLHHDGKLFGSRRHFQRQVPHINGHAREWGAVGFRSGFMLRRLDWLHDLDVEYDASTFDTDPFEPQCDGVGTIFPFWVPRPESGSFGVLPQNSPTPKLRNSQTPPRPGYVELPYTLPQDSTLFLLLRERHPDIWLQKLDWIAKHGGMALLDTHPDYMKVGKGQQRPWEYPVEIYERFLRYVHSKYSGLFWHALPQSVSAFVASRRDLSICGDGRVTGSATPTATHFYDGRLRKSKPKIWIDLDNTPHVPFFEPIIEELQARGYPLLVTARDAFQVCDLADKKRLSYLKIGRHHGKHRLVKGAGLVSRALQLSPAVFKAKPGLAVSHGARAQLLLSKWLGIPSLLIEDYEYSEFPAVMRPTWVVAPEVIPNAALCLRNGHVRKYTGIKEDVYAWKLTPDPSVVRAFGISDSDVLVTVRPPATEAHYHNPESEKLFTAFMERAVDAPQARIILLPRNQRQASFLKEHWPHWFRSGKTVIPGAALDGLNLIWHSDLVVSGGGTMNREAAALGVPVYSIFRGSIGAVDRQLCAEGRLVLIGCVEDVERQIRLVKRPAKTVAEVTSKRALNEVVSTIEEIAASYTR